MRVIKYTEEQIKLEAQRAYDETVKRLQTDAVACFDKKTKATEAEEHIKVEFQEPAWWKAQQLVECCSQEIAWHGLVNKVNDKHYIIEDVLVPPQTVTGTSVDSDPTEWALWSSQLTDDEFNMMRCHMHSHVNMGVFSSAVDDDYQKDMVTKNNGLDYYIFLIFNKKGNVFARVYDIANNVMYDDNEVDVVGYEDSYKLWAMDEIAQQVSYTKPATTYNNKNKKMWPGQQSFAAYGWPED